MKLAAGATQNEVEVEDAKALVKAGVKLVAEGANMPSNAEAISYFHKNDVEFAPAKAANAGGVAVSGLEMAQNSARLSWTKEEVDDKLKVSCFTKEWNENCVSIDMFLNAKEATRS